MDLLTFIKLIYCAPSFQIWTHTGADFITRNFETVFDKEVTESSQVLVNQESYTCAYSSGQQSVIWEILKVFTCPNRCELYDGRAYVKYSMPQIFVLAQVNFPLKCRIHVIQCHELNPYLRMYVFKELDTQSYLIYLLSILYLS